MIYFSSGRWADAEREGLAAADMPALAPVRRQALWMAATAEGMLGTPNRPDPDLGKRKKAVSTLRQVIALGPIQPHERVIAVKIPYNADDLGLARLLLDEWLRQSPNDLGALELLAKVELKGGAYGKAIEAARKILQKIPEHAEMLKVDKEARTRLAELSGTLPP
jgi:tetratricopeptide (TPR) repeat protein